MRIVVQKDSKRSHSFDFKDSSYHRESLKNILVKYNRMIGNDSVAIQQAEKLADAGSFCVFTGQQLGLFGGPSYTILKAISCILLAKELGAIPIFWLATEDHDIAEIDHTYTLDPLGNLEKHRLSMAHDGRFVEELVLNEENIKQLRRFTGSDEINEKSYARFMVRYLVELFKGTGLVFVEPYLLREMAVPFFKKEISKADRIATMLKKTEGPLTFDAGTNLFKKVDGLYRVKIEKTPLGFKVGRKEYSEKELLDLIESHPELFSTNAAARPVLQNTLFPTIAYVAGPTEAAYHKQLNEYHTFHGTNMPEIVQRISATIIPAYAAKLLESARLNPWDVIPCHFTEVMPGLDSGIEELKLEWYRSAIKILGEELSAESIHRQVSHFVKKMQRKTVKSRLLKQRIPSHALHLLRNLIHPHNKPQERVLNWKTFQSTTKQNIIHELLRQVDWREKNHLYCYIK